MKKSILLIFLWCEALQANQLKPTLLERIVQPKITFQSDYLSSATFDGYKGSITTYKQKLQINNEIGGISYSRWEFDWKDEATLPFYVGKRPLEKMHRVKLFGNFPLRINEQWFMLNSLNINTTYEKEQSDSYGAGIVSFFSYKINARHMLQLGAFANYHPVKTLALPVVGYAYRIRESDGFKVALGFPRAYIGYHLNPQILLNAGMIYSQAVIRLANESGIEPGGFSEAKDFQANVGFRYEFGSNFELSADGIYAFKRDFTVYDSHANRIDDYSIAPSLGAIVKLKYLF